MSGRNPFLKENSRFYEKPETRSTENPSFVGRIKQRFFGKPAVVESRLTEEDMQAKFAALPDRPNYEGGKSKRRRAAKRKSRRTLKRKLRK